MSYTLQLSVDSAFSMAHIVKELISGGPPSPPSESRQDVEVLEELLCRHLHSGSSEAINGWLGKTHFLSSVERLRFADSMVLKRNNSHYRLAGVGKFNHTEAESRL